MLHFVLGHFPIALLVTGSALLLRAMIRGDNPGKKPAIAMLVMGAVLSVPTVAAGLWIAGAHEGHHGDALAIHRLLGIATMIVALLALISHRLRHRVDNADLACNLLFFSAAALAGTTGFVGGEMAHPVQEASVPHVHAAALSLTCDVGRTEAGCAGETGRHDHGDLGHGNDGGSHGDAGHAYDTTIAHAR